MAGPPDSRLGLVGDTGAQSRVHLNGVIVHERRKKRDEGKYKLPGRSYCTGVGHLVLLDQYLVEREQRYTSLLDPAPPLNLRRSIRVDHEKTKDDCHEDIFPVPLLEVPTQTLFQGRSFHV